MSAFNLAVSFVFALVCSQITEVDVTPAPEVKQPVAKGCVTPVSFEWPFVDAHGGPLPYRTLDPGKVVLDTDYIEEYREYIRSAFNGLLELREIHGVYVATPPMSDKLEDVKTANLMDEVISLSIEDATTWEALKAFSRAMNYLPHTKYRFGLHPSLWGSGLFGPAEVSDPHVVNVDATDRPARDVLCQILAQAPVAMRYQYFVFDPTPEINAYAPEGHLDICYVEDSRDSIGEYAPMPEYEELVRLREWWGREIREANEFPQDKFQPPPSEPSPKTLEKKE